TLSGGREVGGSAGPSARRIKGGLASTTRGAFQRKPAPSSSTSPLLRSRETMPKCTPRPSADEPIAFSAACASSEGRKLFWGSAFSTPRAASTRRSQSGRKEGGSLGR